MKFRRFFSALLFGTGCALLFTGVLALILPVLDNPQLKLVLDSFATPSEHVLVRSINRAASFALSNSRRVLLTGLVAALLGAWLMDRFASKRKRAPKASPKSLPRQDIPPQTTEKANPFAVEFPVDTQYEWIPPKANAIYHAPPILEKNRIEDAPANESSVAEYEPYRSPRLPKEARAIETSAASESQSGGRILFRNAYQPPVDDDWEPEPDAPSSAPPASPPPAMLTPSPRIRSTMGRHGSSKHR